MTQSEADGRKAGEEARRDVLGRAGRPGAGSRYDALLRYLRGVHARPTKEPPKPQHPDTDPTRK
ncbi:MAG TPA: hypothetical protein VFU73_11355 [Actinocrinis sp.]|nr:hypothetical protein [Actinocrinis sp.]